MDLALGAFADAHIATLSEDQLAEVERWLDMPDPDLLAWLTGEAPTPAEYDTPLFRRLVEAPRAAREAGTTRT